MTRPPLGWFDEALTYATAPLRHPHDGVRALIPLDPEPSPDLAPVPSAHDPANQTDADVAGYALADYLEQHLTRARRQPPVTDPVWRALTTHTYNPDDLTALARAAQNRGRIRHTEALYRAAACGPVRLWGGGAGRSWTGAYHAGIAAATRS